MAFTTLNDIKNILPGQTLFMSRTGSLGFSNYFCTTGWPAPGSTPSSGVGGDIPTSATTGALSFTNPLSGNSYIAQMGAEATSALAGTAAYAGFYHLYDRLWHNSGLSPTTTTAQTVNSTALTRPDANGNDAEAWFQAYSTIGAGTGTMTLSYTNSAGVSSRTATIVSYIAGAGIGRGFPYSLQAGDTGVKTIESETHTVSLTSGTYGLVIRRRVCSAFCGPTTTMGSPTVDMLRLQMPRVYDDACLEVVMYNSASSFGAAVTINMVQG